MQIGTVIAIGSLAVAFAGFLAGRLSASKKNGEETGVILTKLDDLNNNISRLEKQVDKISDRLDNQVEHLQADQNNLRERLASLEGRVNALDGGAKN